MAIVAFVAMCTAAAAGAYNEFGAGIDANNRGAADAAAAHFSRALEAGDLAPGYVPAALFGRARAHLKQRHCAEAIRDLDSAVGLKPDFPDAFSVRAEAHECLGNETAALTDATQAVRLRPAAGYLFTRSRLLWNRGAYGEAHRDAEAAVARDPGNAYYLLWSAVTAVTLNRPEAGDTPQAATSGAWPQPLLDLYGGRVLPEAVWRAAADDRGRGCEADFYVGAWQLSKGQHAAAKTLFGHAAATCPHDFVAFEAARHALKRLE